MLCAIISDQHYGERRDSPLFLSYQEKFLETIFFPTIDRLQIKTVLSLGDLYHKKKTVNFNTANRARKMFIEPLIERGITTHLLVGNHDSTYYKQTNAVNAIQETIGDRSDLIHIYPNPRILKLDGRKILLCPWVNDENRDETYQKLRETNAEVVMAHIDIQGFKMTASGKVSEHGFQKADFAKFKQVLSGHYHHPSEDGNIQYIGAPWEDTWDSYDGWRGFVVWDSETLEVSPVRNPYKFFGKVFWNNGPVHERDFEPTPVVKVVIEKNDNHEHLETYIKTLEEQGSDVEVEDRTNKLNLTALDEVEIRANTSMRDFMTSCAEEAQGDVDKDSLKALLGELYDEVSVTC
jgi:DNA repair exonuclease SbcCD nuclease subunit